MTAMPPAADSSRTKAARHANMRTAATLASIAAVFFGGIVAAQYTGGTTVGIVAVGLGVLGFLFATLGRGRR
ncbi:MAG TPA: hypothetical protein VL742_06050 [Casimicrobiaceae bacterium]|nr:hypothetical protein [Casimicrobiaceae bacterium]